MAQVDVERDRRHGASRTAPDLTRARAANAQAVRTELDLTRRLDGQVDVEGGPWVVDHDAGHVELELGRVVWQSFEDRDCRDAARIGELIARVLTELFDERATGVVAER